MAIKVKGEAIKEGSIPYTALKDVPDWNASDDEKGYIKNKVGDLVNSYKIEIPQTITSTSFKQVELPESITGNPIYLKYQYNSITKVVRLEYNDTDKVTLNVGPSFKVYRTSYALYVGGDWSANHKLYFSKTLSIVPEVSIPYAIARKTDIPEQVQADWSESNESSKAFIKNRPCYINENNLTINYEIIDNHTAKIFYNADSVIVSFYYTDYGTVKRQIAYAKEVIGNWYWDSNGIYQIYFDVDADRALLVKIDDYLDFTIEQVLKDDFFELRTLDIIDCTTLSSAYIPDAIARKYEIENLQNKLTTLEHIDYNSDVIINAPFKGLNKVPLNTFDYEIVNNSVKISISEQLIPNNDNIFYYLDKYIQLDKEFNLHIYNDDETILFHIHYGGNLITIKNLTDNSNTASLIEQILPNIGLLSGTINKVLDNYLIKTASYSDWDEFNPTSFKYIENKPFGFDGYIGTITTTNKIRLTYGVTYYLKMRDNSNDYICITANAEGSTIIVNGPLVSVERETIDGELYMFLNDASSYYPNGIKVYTTLKKLDPFFIDESIQFSNSNVPSTFIKEDELLSDDTSSSILDTIYTTINDNYKDKQILIKSLGYIPASIYKQENTIYITYNSFSVLSAGTPNLITYLITIAYDDVNDLYEKTVQSALKNLL